MVHVKCWSTRSDALQLVGYRVPAAYQPRLFDLHWSLDIIMDAAQVPATLSHSDKVANLGGIQRSSRFKAASLVGKTEIMDDPMRPADGPLSSKSLSKCGVGLIAQVQHAGLRDSCTADTLTVEFLVNTVHFLFPKFDYSWLVEEIKDSLPKVRYSSITPLLSLILSCIPFATPVEWRLSPNILPFTQH